MSGTPRSRAPLRDPVPAVREGRCAVIGSRLTRDVAPWVACGALTVPPLHLPVAVAAVLAVAWCGACLTLDATARRRPGPVPTVGAAVFVVLALLGETGDTETVALATAAGPALASIALSALMFASSSRAPFVLAYVADDMPPAYRRSPVFRTVTAHLTGRWAGVVACVALAQLAAGLACARPAFPAGSLVAFALGALVPLGLLLAAPRAAHRTSALRRHASPRP